MHIEIGFFYYTLIKMLSINNPYINHKNATKLPEAIIGKGSIDASLFLMILFCKINYHI